MQRTISVTSQCQWRACASQRRHRHLLYSRVLWKISDAVLRFTKATPCFSSVAQSAQSCLLIMLCAPSDGHFAQSCSFDYPCYSEQLKAAKRATQKTQSNSESNQAQPGATQRATRSNPEQPREQIRATQINFVVSVEGIMSTSQNRLYQIFGCSHWWWSHMEAAY